MKIFIITVFYSDAVPGCFPNNALCNDVTAFSIFSLSMTMLELSSDGLCDIIYTFSAE